MTIYIGSDHAGLELKQQLSAYLTKNGYICLDKGTHTTASCDYSDYAHAVAHAVSELPETLRGVLICGSGQGVMMTANKHPHVRAALVWIPEIAILARQHNDANILCLPARFINTETAINCLRLFLETPFEGGRHALRTAKIDI